MTVEPLTPTPDDKDWTWVLDTPCPECGFDAVAIKATDVATQVRDIAPAFEAVLDRPDARDRPEPGVWSPLEYGCHVRDLSLIHISEPTRRTPISYAVFCLKKKKKYQ